VSIKCQRNNIFQATFSKPNEITCFQKTTLNTKATTENLENIFGYKTNEEKKSSEQNLNIYQ
jgi:hypothetical protein